jgi:two-component system NarL family sensor kinase
VEHARRGLRVQVLLRVALAAFMMATIAVVPPEHDRGGCWVLVVSYAVWSLGTWWWVSAGGVAADQWLWVALLVDCGALVGLTLLADASLEQSWTADVVVTGFVLIPLMAATQLRPGVCAAIAGPLVAAYFLANVATRAANTEPWGSVVLRTVALAALSLGCVALSHVQLSRVRTIVGLAEVRTQLLGELTTIEARERAALAEALHDGALQYVLAARHDLERARLDGDAEAFDRLDHALAESSTLLRSTVAQLHPAVLREAGLARAVRDLVGSIAGRDRLAAVVDVSDWPDGGTGADELLYGCARELLANVVKHAEGARVRVVLSVDEGAAWLVIADDGRGFDRQQAAAGVAQGHIGLSSLRVRVAAAGGAITVEPGPQGGTVATVTVPLAPVR